jgi:hypothetical protein
MLITSIPQYIQGITNAKVDLTTTDLTTLFTVPSDADFTANRLHVVASIQELSKTRVTTSAISRI